MIQNIPIDGLVPHSIIRDLKAAQSLIPPKSSARLYRIPVDDFNKAVEQVIQKNKYMPFRPMLLGLPVDMTVRAVPEMVVVADDDTNIAQNAIREEDANA